MGKEVENSRHIRPGYSNKALVALTIPSNLVLLGFIAN
ncbi:hypothetical protein GCHA_0263 [Paraglaciecola chathamensis S18K6]|uniref:Uncharacterized protein n=2 Tax=Paraglaciecola chathamensis TaxID=368405 RepID=A0ABQ0IEQ2_9ALTE|nr:hypothetical protein GAGA_5061 [Paraglaciecola agarilytica NO2]GAC08228.1 hypothetical protein GCHA_0263 [Paraglaciecola chathamensis S18K6]